MRVTIPLTQIILGEVDKFFNQENQEDYTAAKVETILLGSINRALVYENISSGLKGSAAHKQIKTLPPVVVARCVMERDLPHLALLGESEREHHAHARDTAQLVTYISEGVDAGLYVPAAHLVRRAAKQYAGLASARDYDEVVFHIRESVRMITPTENADIVALKNGIFNLRTKEFSEFSPEVVLTTKCEVAWNENATTSPVIDGWTIDSWIREIADGDPEIEALLWQVVAALFRPGHAFSKAVILMSESGSNGKGSFLELLRNLVGASRVATPSIYDFGGQFLPIQLIDCFAVLSDESDVGGYLGRAAMLKLWLDHNWVTMDRKGRDTVNIKARGLSVFCLNELPGSKDKSESLYRRFLPVPFRRRYMGEARNPLIKTDYLARREVLEYVAHKALMMPIFDSFSEPAASVALLEDIRVENDPVRQFAEKFLGEVVWDLLPWNFLYALYSAWMRREVPSGRAVSARQFTHKLTAYVDSHPECGWTIPRGADGTQKKVRTQQHIMAPEPLIVEYDLSDWLKMKPQGGSANGIGIPHNIPATARGLLRA